jgi:hypothetical protein
MLSIFARQLCCLANCSPAATRQNRRVESPARVEPEDALATCRTPLTFITRALDNGASLEEVQRAAGHADATTTKLYDRRGYNPEKSASFFASY